MPHLVTHRPRVSNLGQSDPESSSHKAWETINAFAYKLGGLAFIGGSVFFLPALGAYERIGDWLFFLGSLLYLLVTGHDLLEVIKFWRAYATQTFADYIEYVCATFYVLGSALFALGSLFFLPWWGWSLPGAWTFIIGAVLFVIGGCINLLQVVEAPSLIYMQLFNLTVGMFVIGSALFVVASVPFVWTLHDPTDKMLIFGFVGGQYIAGSTLFFAGGLFIYYRKLVLNHLEPWCRSSELGTFFVHALREEIRDYGQLRRRGDKNTRRSHIG